MGHKGRNSWDHRGGKPAMAQTLLTTVIFGGLIVLLWTNLNFLSSHADEMDVGGNMAGAGARRQAQELGGAGERRRDNTLVIYVYNAADEEQERNFAFFLRYGIDDSGPSYRVIITKGPGIKEFPRLPALPPNAHYLRTEACSTTWGAIDAVSRVLPISEHQYFIVLDSKVRGPFIPAYAAAGAQLHWTEAFTNKLSETVKLVGSTISCEGAPRGGDAAGEWRGNPYVSPHAWATDADGWALLAAEHGVFRCHGTPWDTRYYSDAGASLAVLRAGWTLDCLLARYQGVDWASPTTWQCNQRVRPDLEMHYDGISIAPYETVFVPVSEATAAARWSFVEAAGRYERWLDNQLRPAETRPGVHGNAWISNHWQAKAEKLVYMNTRGPECFDFNHYKEENPDLEVIAYDELSLWEHFMMLGQFQGRPHKFTCPMPVGNSYRIAYILSRGPRCFDYRYYAEQHSDLERAGITTPEALFEHFAEFGQFERRRIRFTCADTLVGLPAGFDNEPPGRAGVFSQNVAGKEDAATAAARVAAEERAALLAKEGDAGDAVQQALKGALVGEAAKDALKAGKKGKKP